MSHPGVNRIEAAVVAGASALVFLAAMLPFLPGPAVRNDLVMTIYFLTAIGSLFAAIFIPVGCLFWILPAKQRRHHTRLTLLVIPKLMVFLPIVAFVTVFLLGDHVKDRTRDVAIAGARPLIAAIETYRGDTGRYPASVADLVPGYLEKVPESGILGIARYEYERRDDSYSLYFTQVFSGFSVEVVRYDPGGGLAAMKRPPRWRLQVYD